MMEYFLNIIGSEWVIIIFVALVLILGTNKLPEAAKKLGKASAEYKKAKNEVTSQINEISDQNIHVNKPVESEREKLEVISKSLGIDFKDKTTKELQELIAAKMNQDTKE